MEKIVKQIIEYYIKNKKDPSIEELNIQDESLISRQ